MTLDRSVGESSKKTAESALRFNSLRISSNGYAITGFSKNEGKNISVFIPEYLIQFRDKELMISPSRFTSSEISLEIQIEHGRMIAQKIC